MGPKYFEERREGYETILETMYRLRDEKMPVARIKEETGEIGFNVTELTQDLILLGEIELCEVTGISGRVWLKRRETRDGKQERVAMARSFWQGYTSKGYRDRMTDRLFTNRWSAILHLSDAAVGDPNSFKPLSFLDDVWVAPSSNVEGYEEMTAVVRRETIFQTSNAKDRLERRS